MDKKKITYWCIIGAIILISNLASFCAGRYIRLGILQQSSNGVEQSINNTGDSINRAENEGVDGINYGLSAISNADLGIGYLQSANIIALEQGLVYDEVKRLVEEYSENIQSLYSTEAGIINDLFEINIRRAEYLEQFAESVANEYGLSIESIGEQ